MFVIIGQWQLIRFFCQVHCGRQYRCTRGVTSHCTRRVVHHCQSSSHFGARAYCRSCWFRRALYTTIKLGRNKNCLLRVVHNRQRSRCNTSIIFLRSPAQGFLRSLHRISFTSFHYRRRFQPYPTIIYMLLVTHVINTNWMSGTIKYNTWYKRLT